MSSDITIRFLFTQSLLWSEEASRLCLTTLAFIGGAAAYRARHHTAIQFVTRFLPERLRAGMTRRTTRLDEDGLATLRFAR